MRYKIDLIYEIKIAALLEHEDNNVIEGYVYVETGNRGRTGNYFYESSLLFKIEDKKLVCLGYPGMSYTIDGKEYWKLVTGYNECLFYHPFDFGFIDCCLVDGLLEVSDKIKEAEKIEYESHMVKKNSELKLIDKLEKVIKKYKMEEQHDDFV
ncbi:MAG: hypothetical protein ACRCX2_24165 [Paraclostridium sp.]